MKYGELVNLKVPAHDAYREIVRSKDCGASFFHLLKFADNYFAAMLTMGGEMY